MYSYSDYFSMTIDTSNKLIQDMQKLKRLRSFHFKGAVNYLSIGVQLRQENAVCICRHFL